MSVTWNVKGYLIRLVSEHETTYSGYVRVFSVLTAQISTVHGMPCMHDERQLVKTVQNCHFRTQLVSRCMGRIPATLAITSRVSQSIV
jgi:hypothetical protein